ncbi:hypothetical protein PILCRDRAFT_827884 [Piloderma croceum F 1598]|uniref:Uncharacterized protein n=1 Tax=Piloderma croceum (strain F 1598) TaxID=765440 RepID=A0A0C3F461_PILCF|nr:hypothetical protein PILCRDRAFT_827884 [Piloderma croceum F 1598]
MPMSSPTFSSPSFQFTLLILNNRYYLNPAQHFVNTRPGEIYKHPSLLSNLRPAFSFARVDNTITAAHVEFATVDFI